MIDTTSWKVIASIDAGVKPTRVALQHDGRYLWVGNDGTEDAEQRDHGDRYRDARQLRLNSRPGRDIMRSLSPRMTAWPS